MKLSRSFSFFQFATLLFLSFSVVSFAQQKSFYTEDVQVLVQSGPIVNFDQIDGYFFLYRTNKKKGLLNRYYELQLVDHNLEPIGSRTLLGQIDLTITSIAYNGSLLAVELIDNTDKIYRGSRKQYENYRIEIYNGQGNEIRRENLQYITFDTNAKYYQPKDIQQKRLIATPQGFINYSTTLIERTATKTRSKIMFVPNDPGQETWTYFTESNKETPILAAFLGKNDHTLVSLEYRLSLTIPGKVLDFGVFGLDLKSGKEVFYLDSEHITQYPIRFRKAAVEDDRIILFGEYFERDSDYSYDYPKGLARIDLTSKGEILDQKYVPYEAFLKEPLEVDASLEFKTISLHDYIINNDQLVLPMEVYHIGKTNAMKKHRFTRNTCMLVLSKDLEFLQLDKINREESLTFIGIFTKHLPLSKLSTLFRDDENDQVRYRFSRSYEDGLLSVFDLLKKDSDEKAKIKTYVLNRAGSMQEEMDLDPKSNHFTVHPARNDYILVMEYYGEEKRMDTRLERIRIE